MNIKYYENLKVLFETSLKEKIIMVINQETKDIIISELAKKKIMIHLNDIFGDLTIIYFGIYIDGLFSKYPSEQTVGIYESCTDIQESKEDINIIIATTGEVKAAISQNILTVDYDAYKDINLLAKSTLLKYNTNVIFSSGVTKLNKTVILVETSQFNHIQNKPKLLGFICAMLTRFVAAKHIKELSPVAKEILSKNTFDDILNYLEYNSNIDWSDIQNQVVFAQMRKTFTASQEKRKKNLENNIQRCRDELNNISEMYNAKLSELNEYLGTTINVENVDAQVEFLYSFIKNCKSIANIAFSGPYMIYDIVTELNNYDEDIYYTHTNLGNLRYAFGSDAIFWKKLLDQIFIERKYKIMVSKQCAIKFDNIPELYIQSNGLIGSNIRLKSSDDLMVLYPSTIPSPHASRLNCSGTYHHLFNEALRDNNIMLAINYTIAWTANINWADSAAPRYLFQDLQRYSPCLVDSEGNTYIPSDIVQSFKEEREKNNG